MIRDPFTRSSAALRATPTATYPEPKGRARLLVASGKGGVGTSVVASLLALAAAERGDRVLLVDATETSGSIHHLFAVRATRSLWSLADGRTSPQDILIPIDDRLTLVAGGTAGDTQAPRNEAERRTAIVQITTLFDQYDVVVIDGGARLDSLSALIDVAAPRLLLVTSADRLALAANYALVKSIGPSHAAAPIAVVANRHGEALAGEACDFLRGACSHFLACTIDVASPIPDDPSLQAATGAGMPVRDAIDGSPAADAVRRVLSELIPSSRRISARTSAMTAPDSSSRRWS